jgi:hypothetical protein
MTGHNDLPLLHNLTSEDRLTFAKWAQGVAILYTSGLLILALIISQHILAEPASDGALKDPSTQRAGASERQIIDR